MRGGAPELLEEKEREREKEGMCGWRGGPVGWRQRRERKELRKGGKKYMKREKVKGRGR